MSQIYANSQLPLATRTQPIRKRGVHAYGGVGVGLIEKPYQFYALKPSRHGERAFVRREFWDDIGHLRTMTDTGARRH